MQPDDRSKPPRTLAQAAFDRVTVSTFFVVFTLTITVVCWFGPAAAMTRIVKAP